MALSKRIFIFYFLFVALCGYFMVSLFSSQVYPSVKQTTEETLIDTANFLAELVSLDVKNGVIDENYLKHMDEYRKRNPKASIWGTAKNSVSMTVYITDNKGIVLYDSEGKAVGKDYSQWNDVYLTLQGKYGARSSKLSEDSPSIMYVAAPIVSEGKIIGVLSVGKPTSTVNSYVEKAKHKLIYFGILLLMTSLAVGALLSWWLGVSFRKLTQYAQLISQNQRVKKPTFYGKEMNVLADAVKSLRQELDGKQYVEHYVNTLTHELKSPIAAIKGANELLQSDGMNEEMHRHFTKNIERETERLQQLIDRLLSLSLLEQKEQLDHAEEIDLSLIIKDQLSAKSAIITKKSFLVHESVPKEIRIKGDSFLMSQAVSNILDNAFGFMDTKSNLWISLVQNGNRVMLSFKNEGPFIPEYALSRLCERFYSLPRPDTGQKSTGLGLNFVQEIISLHQGRLEIRNWENGVEVVLKLSNRMIVL